MEMKIVRTSSPEDSHPTVKVILQPTAPFDFKQALTFLKVSGAQDITDTFDPSETWIERPIYINNLPLLVRLSNISLDINSPALELSISKSDDSESPLREEDIIAAAEWANRRFFLDVDMMAVRKTLAVNEYGELLVNKFWPNRPVNLPDAWEGLLKTVVSVQIYPGLAQRLQRGLLDLYGQAVRFDGKEYRLFPGPEKLAIIPPDELLNMKFSRQKASYIPGISQMVLAEPQKYNWEKLRTLPGEEAVAILDDLPGVGSWTASYCAMRALPHLDVITKEEGLRKTLARAYDRSASISAEETEKLMKVYAPYRTFACYYTYMLMYNA